MANIHAAPMTKILDFTYLESGADKYHRSRLHDPAGRFEVAKRALAHALTL